jgi:hypothetical protein
MSDRLGEIADLLAKVRHFCSTVGREPLGLRDTEGRAVEDRLLLLVPPMEDFCNQIGAEIGFAALAKASDAPERERMLAESEHRLDVMLAQLHGALHHAQSSKTAHELIQQIERLRQKRSEQARDAAQQRGLTDYRERVIRERSLPEYKDMSDREYCKARTRDYNLDPGRGAKKKLSYETVRGWLKSGRR